MKIFLSHGEEIQLENDSSGKDLALHLKLINPQQALAVKINGQTRDLSSPLKEGDTVEFIDFSSDEGKEIFWHSTAHILAQAILRLYPEAKPTIGPPIEKGFYYDFANLPLSEEDLPKIEKEMQKIVKENHKPERVEFSSSEEALSSFKENSYKMEIIKDIPKGEPLTAYRQGEFFDLCRGPHLPSLGKVKALKLTKTSGAYWRGNSENEMLTRIYGISFPDKQDLKDYLHQLEEAKKRDHRLLGTKLNLFSVKEEGPGMPFLHPKGMVIWNKLIDFWRELHREADYEEIKTPVMLSQQLWETSGHWANYRENMFISEIENRTFAIKPMNCPGCILYYKSHLHSYRDFPLRIGEIGHVHRHEPSGALSGLFRVQSFHQDDAHIFMTREQIHSEILGVLILVEKIYSAFGLAYHLELSTRPEKSIGKDEDWEISTEALRNALVDSGKEFKVNEGDGAFYGPKIDMHIKDAIGRTWQCGTIQLDMSLPERFQMEFTDKDGERKRPIMIHRAIFGSLERFFGVIIEHFAGNFPLWLSPRQIRILNVADRHASYADELCKKFKAHHFEVETDETNESISKKVRLAQIEKVNYILVVGDQEVENKTVTVRTRDNVVRGQVPVNELLALLEKEVVSRQLHSSYSQ